MPPAKRVSNDEILEVLTSLKEKNEAMVILKEEEVVALREILKTISVEDLKYMKEYAEDKKAVGRVIGKWKSLFLATTAVIIAYFTTIKLVAPYLKDTLIRFISTGSGPV